MSRAPRHDVAASTARSRQKLRRSLAAVAAGDQPKVALDLGDEAVDTARIVSEITAPFGPASIELTRIIGALQVTGLHDTVLDQLAAQDAHVRARSARLVGALRLEAAVPALVPLLAAPESRVRNAAARALGRIGGTRSAAALLRALRSGTRDRTIVTELARGAPDLFLEAALCAEASVHTTVAVAAAAGLRHRSTAIRPLLGKLASPSPFERAAGCRALGWIGKPATMPAIVACLNDTDWRVRVSAAKAVRRLHPSIPPRHLARLLADRHMSVRRAARAALQEPQP